MKPTQEQVEAAKALYHLTFGWDEEAVPKVAEWLAARDAERDARWRSVLDPIREMNNDISQLKCGTGCVECGAFWTWTGYGKPWHFPDCALANLGAEEKRWADRIRFTGPKCGECHGREFGDRKACPACSKGLR